MWRIIENMRLREVVVNLRWVDVVWMRIKVRRGQRRGGVYLVNDG